MPPPGVLANLAPGGGAALPLRGDTFTPAGGIALPPSGGTTLRPALPPPGVSLCAPTAIWRTLLTSSDTILTWMTVVAVR